MLELRTFWSDVLHVGTKDFNSKLRPFRSFVLLHRSTDILKRRSSRPKYEICKVSVQIIDFLKCSTLSPNCRLLLNFWIIRNADLLKHYNLNFKICIDLSFFFFIPNTENPSCCAPLHLPPGSRAPHTIALSALNHISSLANHTTQAARISAVVVLADVVAPELLCANFRFSYSNSCSYYNLRYS